MEHQVSRIELLFQVIRSSPQQVKIIHPVISQIMQYDTGLGFIGNGIQLNAVCSCSIQCIIVKRDQLGVVIYKSSFGPVQYFIQLIVGIKNIVIMRNGVLNKSFGEGKFFSIRFF